jgi:hypothetical protein
MKSITLNKKIFEHPLHGRFTVCELPEATTHLAHKAFYFVTKSGEAGILDCLNQMPSGMEKVGEIFDKIFKEEYKFDGFRIDSMRQDAWRYFSDKSINNDIWFLTAMYGSPFKENATDEEMESFKFIEEKEITVELQEITYNKWVRLSEEEKIKHMRLFLDSPVEGSDYIFNHTFHTA